MGYAYSVQRMWSKYLRVNGEHQFINLLHTSPSILSALPLALAVPVTVSETRHFVNCLHPNNSEEDQSRFRFIFTKSRAERRPKRPCSAPSQQLLCLECSVRQTDARIKSNIRFNRSLFNS
jgi:hypothetical protein